MEQMPDESLTIDHVPDLEFYVFRHETYTQFAYKHSSIFTSQFIERRL